MSSAESERILQFGGGNFLRAFADTFVHEANQRGEGVGRVVVVQSTGSRRAALINRQDGKYHVIVRGLLNGQPVDRVEEVTSIRRALVAGTQWDEVLECARSPSLRWILSNTTEAGYDLDEADGRQSKPPRSFPGKLLLVLHHRFEAGQSAPTILPCELFDQNADRLLEILEELAQAWNLGPDFRQWLTNECVWLNTLVDRIVTGKPREHPLLASDELLTVTEPFALWVMEEKDKADYILHHEAIVRTTDVRPYRLRKVRLLNGAHTALVSKALPLGFKTVREAVEDESIGAWLTELVFEELVPTLEGKVEGAGEFARQTLERFRNPYVDHKLSDIALHHETKVRVRLLPSYREFTDKFGHPPPRLREVLAG